MRFGVYGLVKSALRVIRNLRMITREFDDPLRSLLVGLAANGVDVDLERLRLLKPFDAPFRNQCLALLLSVPDFNLEKAVELLPLSEPLRTHGLVLLALMPSLNVRSVFALYYYNEPFQQAFAVLAGHPTLDVDPVRLEIFTRCRPEVPGHTDIFVRDILGGAERMMEDELHLRGALEWLLHSQAVTRTGGFAAAYLFTDGWLPPYPETTGYIIPTLFDAHAVLGDGRLRTAAVEAARWTLDIQLPSGAIQAGYWGRDPQQFWSADTVPSAFNTGQVVLGWNRAFQETGDRRFLDAFVRACHYLVECVDEVGIFREGLSPGPTNPTRSYYTRVAYAMAWTARLTGETTFEAVARRHLDWVLQQLQPDGWFLHAGFQDDDTPLTHTMAYTAEGLLYAGELLGDDRYVDASRRHVVRAADACERQGLFLPAHFTSGWKSADRFSCVPGNAQFALLWCRHGRRDGDLSLVNTGLRMVDWLKRRQSLDNLEPGVRGGLPAAWPIDGGYTLYGYVNWAAKYFVDALLEARVAKQELAGAG